MLWHLHQRITKKDGRTYQTKALKLIMNLVFENNSTRDYIQVIWFGGLRHTHSAYKWKLKEQGEANQATFDELCCLKRLLDICISLGNIPFLRAEDLAWFERLRRFQIAVGPRPYSACSPTYCDKRRLILSGADFSGKRIQQLLINTSSLVLHNCSEINWMFKALATNTGVLLSLKSLTIANCGSFGRVSRDIVQIDLMPNLEELCFRHLPYLNNIAEVHDQLGLSITKLRSTEAIHCPLLTYIIPDTFIQNPDNLEKIKLSFCDNLFELVRKISVENEPSNSNYRTYRFRAEEPSKIRLPLDGRYLIAKPQGGAHEILQAAIFEALPTPSIQGLQEKKRNFFHMKQISSTNL